jgi:hypothetical protein
VVIQQLQAALQEANQRMQQMQVDMERLALERDDAIAGRTAVEQQMVQMMGGNAAAAALQQHQHPSLPDIAAAAVAAGTLPRSTLPHSNTAASTKRLPEQDDAAAPAHPSKRSRWDGSSPGLDREHHHHGKHSSPLRHQGAAGATATDNAHGSANGLRAPAPVSAAQHQRQPLPPPTPPHGKGGVSATAAVGARPDGYSVVLKEEAEEYDEAALGPNVSPPVSPRSLGRNATPTPPPSSQPPLRQPVNSVRLWHSAVTVYGTRDPVSHLLTTILACLTGVKSDDGPGGRHTLLLTDLVAALKEKQSELAHLHLQAALELGVNDGVLLPVSLDASSVGAANGGGGGGGAGDGAQKGASLGGWRIGEERLVEMADASRRVGPPECLRKLKRRQRH